MSMSYSGVDTLQMHYQFNMNYKSIDMLSIAFTSIHMPCKCTNIPGWKPRCAVVISFEDLGVKKQAFSRYFSRYRVFQAVLLKYYNIWCNMGWHAHTQYYIHIYVYTGTFEIPRQYMCIHLHYCNIYQYALTNTFTCSRMQQHKSLHVRYTWANMH